MIPNFVLDYFLNSVREEIEIKTHFNIDKLDLSKKIKKIDIPAIFVSSKEDNFVSCKHTELMYNNYSGNKKLIYV